MTKTAFYWVIQYEICLLSDFHVGEGMTLIGGNLHGLRLDENGFPFLPHTQVRGLLRRGGLLLARWLPELKHLKHLFDKNFPQGGNRATDRRYWSYTRAAFSPDTVRGHTPRTAGLLGGQFHIRCEDGGAPVNLFAYQKGRGAGAEWHWQGCIYSVEEADVEDVAFIVACMRADDRVGARRSRGYGKVNWAPTHIHRYHPERRDHHGQMDLTKTLMDKEACVGMLFGE